MVGTKQILNRTTDWSTFLGRTDVLILDTETTGFKKTAEVVQVAVIDTTGAGRFDELVLPAGGIPREASKIHGLTRANLVRQGAQGWPVHHNRFFELVCSADVVFVYNLDFDVRILRQTCSRYGLPFRKFVGRCAMLDYAAHRKIANQWRSGFKWHKLADAARHENVKAQSAMHQALSDCEIVLELMRAVVAGQSGR